MPLIRGIVISFPTSASEQELIIKQVQTLREKVQSLKSKYQQELNSLEELKKSILQKAFEGEL
jgi:type I restriction enzyme S subunit